MTCPAPSRPGRGSPAQAVRDLTERQCELLAFVSAYTSVHGYAPAVRDFFDHFGWTSTNAVYEHMECLREKRRVTWVPHKARTLRTTESGEAAAQAYLRQHPELLASVKRAAEVSP